MIKNEKAYRITRHHADGFAAAIRALEAGQETDPRVSPRLRQAEIDGLKSVLEGLQEEMREYEALREYEAQEITERERVKREAQERDRSEVLRVSAAHYDWLKQKLAEPPQENPALRHLFSQSPPWEK